MRVCACVCACVCVCVCVCVCPSKQEGANVAEPKEMTLEQVKQHLELRTHRVDELEGITQSMSFALEQATRQKSALVRKVATLRRRLRETRGSVDADAGSAGAAEGAGAGAGAGAGSKKAHECSSDVRACFEAGPLGLVLVPSPKGALFALEIEGLAKVCWWWRLSLVGGH